ncbi:helix-turn-helix domain-containing protein [Arthrobacter sp. TMN-50]
MREPDLTIKELAEQLRLSADGVRDLVSRGYFPNAYKAGRGGTTSPWRIPVTDLADYKSKQPKAPRRTT